MTSRRAHTRDEVLELWHERDLDEGMTLQPLQSRHRDRFVKLAVRNQTEIGAWANWVWSPFGPEEAALEIERFNNAGPGGLHHIELRRSSDNHGSRAVARKAGFTPEGVLRDAWRVKDQPQSLVLHSRLATDPR